MIKKIGLLVMAYGTPNNLNEVESYYTHIRHGRKPSVDLLEDLKRRYRGIGGNSPLAKITRNQAKQLVLKLNNWFETHEFVMYLGFKHAVPFIEDAVQQMKNDGIEEAISIILAPHYSIYSVKAYNDRAKTMSKKINGPVIHAINSWYSEPKFITFWANQIKKIMLSIDDFSKSIVIFSAHSLPERILLNGDPYPEQVAKTAELIASKANIKSYSVGWQSAGRTGEPWLGPDVKELTRGLYEQHGYTSFIYCPIGFVAEHLEVLYDIDYECKLVTDKFGVNYYRPKMPNANNGFIEGLASVISKKVRETQRILVE
ncbi:ferrochelatase [Bacillus sp. OV166]|uniref:ferrochelatase n=1 Tax=Bacillus sp. OV166 TaxID=1882763 RepID=UPI000A2AE517|nr:ferrochelatase [Bacillus sp. OV166]SMQ86736.1 ferrochelatase [Bacillus sp. OV166]